MTATPEQAVDDILDVFRAAWNPTGFIAVYDLENTGKDNSRPPDTEDPWTRVSMRHVTGNQSSLTGGLGTIQYTNTGTLTMSLFVPIGEGLVRGRQLASTLQRAYRGISTPRQVWFRRSRINEIGSDGHWFQINIIVEFEYDEIH